MSYNGLDGALPSRSKECVTMANVKPTDDIGAETQGLALGAVVLPVALPDAEQAVR